MNIVKRRLVGAAMVLVLGISGAVMGQAQQGQAQVPAEPAKESPHPPAVALWPNGAPGFESRKDEPEKVDWRAEPENNITFPVLFNVHNPSIIPFLPDKAKATGAAVIIAPGGGHMFHTIDREGYDLGKILAEKGIAAFVLKYRLQNDRAVARGESPYRSNVHAVQDAQRAVRVIRSRAEEWGVKTDRIGIIGFSAGGQVAGLLSLNNDKGDPNATDPVEKFSSRPDFSGWVYGGPPNNAEFKSDLPPTWLMCAYNDNGPARNLANAFLKLKEAGVPAELHIYSTGGHGFGVRQDRPFAVTKWPDRFVEWMTDLGMMSK